MESTLVSVEGSDRASESGSEVRSSVVFLLGGPDSGLGPMVGGLLGNSCPYR